MTTAISSPKASIDPAKVVRCALQDAASVAGLLITTEAMIAEKPKKDAAPDAGRRRHGRNGRDGLLKGPSKIVRQSGRRGAIRGGFFVGAISFNVAGQARKFPKLWDLEAGKLFPTVPLQIQKRRQIAVGDDGAIG